MLVSYSWGLALRISIAAQREGSLCREHARPKRATFELQPFPLLLPVELPVLQRAKRGTVGARIGALHGRYQQYLSGRTRGLRRGRLRLAA